MELPEMQLGRDGYRAFLVAGPTASGKSSLAMRIAMDRGATIINADSMQVYDGLRILTARPTPDDERQVPHRLYGHVDPTVSYSTGAWLRDAAEAMASARKEDRAVVVVGGTGLYFKALTSGLAPVPEIDPSVRDRLRARLADEGLAEILAELATLDPEAAARLNPSDSQRIVRSLEVIVSTGHPLAHWQALPALPPVIDLTDAERTFAVVLSPERDLRRARIARRFTNMLEEGVVDEVAAFLARDIPADRPAMKAIGLREFGAFLEGALALDAVGEAVVVQTQRYSKRQMTWFRNQFGEAWHHLQPDAEPFWL